MDSNWSLEIFRSLSDAKPSEGFIHKENLINEG